MATSDDDMIASHAEGFAWSFPYALGIALATTWTHPWGWGIALLLGVGRLLTHRRAHRRALERLDALRRDHGEDAERQALAIARLWP